VNKKNVILWQKTGQDGDNVCGQMHPSGCGVNHNTGSFYMFFCIGPVPEAQHFGSVEVLLAVADWQ